jgi:SAM-dependent methyltransferase
MNRQYWEAIAPDYETEIFSVSAHDRHGLIQQWLERLASPDSDAIDLGCGIGLWLPRLAPLFRRVTAVDISEKLLRRAREHGQAHRNLRFLRADMSRPGASMPSADLILCVNAILTASMVHRQRLFTAIARHLRPGGHLLLTVPALESALLTKRRLIDWHLADGLAPHAAVRSALASDQPHATGWIQGVVPVNGVPTKHYLREELEVLLGREGVDTLARIKLEYPWTTEFSEPPEWMREPYPWDWLVVGRRREIGG